MPKLDEETIKELIPSVGLRILFKEKVRKYLNVEEQPSALVFLSTSSATVFILIKNQELTQLIAIISRFSAKITSIQQNNRVL